MKKVVKVNETYQTGYSYTLSESAGKNFDAEFTPDLSPAEMLRLGIFGGDYFNEVPAEFPKEWFEGVKLSAKGAQRELNYFNVNASQPLSVWRQKGWIYWEDPHGWVLWYFRYFRGRRILGEDQCQIKRWKAMRRHISQVQQNCQAGDGACRPRQRQALLHWAYDSRKF